MAKAKRRSKQAKKEVRRELKLSAFYPHPVADVWQALSDERELAQWFGEGAVAARMGARTRVLGLAAEVQVVDRERELSMIIRGPSDNDASIVTWRLSERGEGTQVEIEQRWLAAEELKPHPTVVSMALYRQERMIRLRSELLLELLSEWLGAGVSWRAVA